MRTIREDESFHRMRESARDHLTADERRQIDDLVAAGRVYRARPGEESTDSKVAAHMDAARRNSNKVSARQATAAKYGALRIARAGVKL